MSEKNVKPIYLSHSLQALKYKANVKIYVRSIERLIKVMTKLQDGVTNSRKAGDQEMEYVYIFRYLSGFEELIKLPEFLKKGETYMSFKTKITEVSQRSSNYLPRLELLTDILVKRYKEKEDEMNKRHEESVDKMLKVAEVPKHDNDIEPVNKSSISTKSLYNILMSMKSMKSDEKKINGNDILKDLLIIDVRSERDYDNSRLICNTISVPEEVINRGKSAVKMELSLSSEAAIQWKCRGKFDKLILMDWRTRLSTLDPNSKLAILRDIMTNWDPSTTYKSPILILEGGYEDLILRYPQVSTNPKVDIPYENSNNNILDLPVLDYPMSYVEEEKPPPPKPVPKPTVLADPSNSASNNSENVSSTIPDQTSPLSVNRSLKPKTYSSSKQIGKNTIRSGSEGEGDLPPKSFEADEVIVLSSTDDAASDSEPVSISSKPHADHEATKSSEELKKEVDQLRKFKPVPSEIIMDASSEEDLAENNMDADEDSEIIHSALKEDGSSSANLRRSYSSPNVAQMEDYELGTKPFFSRATKPAEEKVPITSYIMGERMDSTYGKTALGLTGLKNVANNCYMNSIIQCLSNTEDLLKELVRLDKPAVNVSSPTSGRVANEVITTFRSLWSGDVKCYSLRELKNLMGCYQEIYRGSNHQDSHEFLIILLEYLHNDLNIPAEVTTLAGANEESGEKAWGEFRRKNCSPIQRLFCGQERSTVLCATCGHSSVTFGQFFQLAVPIPTSGRPPTLDSCIRLYLAGERVSGWQCPNCKAPRDAFKKIDITRLPPVLIIALKRFSQEGGSWLEKRESLVTYPLEGLHMKEHTVPGSEQRYDSYDLHALSTHTGSLRAGHYRAIAKNHLNHKWYMFDDSAVYPMSPQEVCNIAEVYIMFYHAAK